MSERTVVADLGWCVGKLIINGGTSVGFTIISPAETTDGRYAPAESVCIFGRRNLVKLQQFLNENLKAQEVE